MTDDTPLRRSSPGLALRVAAGLALAAVPLGTAGAQDGAAAAQTDGDGPAEFRIRTDGWTGGAVPGRGGGFSHCVVERDMTDGFAVLFQAGPNFNVNIVLVSDGFDLEPDTESEATIVVDGAFSQTYPAYAPQPSVLIVATRRDPDLVDRIMRGANATVSGAHGEVTIPLNGTFAAFGALEDCVQKARELIAAGEIPAPGQGAGGQQGAGGGQGDGRMTARVIDDLLRRAGIENVAIADPSSIPEGPLDLGQVWQLDGSLGGGLHQTPRDQSDSMATFISGIVGVLEDHCPGETTVERGEIERVLGQYAFADASVTCRAESVSAHWALFFALDDNYYSVFFHESASAQQAPRAEEATGKLATYIRGLIDDRSGTDGATGDEGADTGDLSITGAAEATSGIEESDNGDAAPASDAEDEAGRDGGTGTEDSPAQ